MSSIPSEFLGKCDAQERDQVLAWWQSLDTPNQSEIRVLLDRRHDSMAYIYGLNASGDFDWHQLPFIDSELPLEDADSGENEWRIDYFQHLLDHPELVADDYTVVRTFHICTAHQSAQEATASGKLDEDFACSNHDSQCPIVRFLRDTKSAQLLGYTTRGRVSLWLCRP